MKQILFLTLVVSLILSPLALAADHTSVEEITMLIGAKRYDIPVLIVDGTSYVSIRKVIEQVNGLVYWYGEENRQICLVFKNSKVYFDFHGNVYMQNGEYLPIDEDNFLWHQGHAFIKLNDMVSLLENRWDRTYGA